MSETEWPQRGLKDVRVPSGAVSRALDVPALWCPFGRGTTEGPFPLPAVVSPNCPGSFREPFQVNNSKCGSGVSSWLVLQDLPRLFTAGAKEQHHS